MAEDEKIPKMIGVRLEPALMRKVCQEAKKEHRSFSGMVRVYVIEAIEAREEKKGKKKSP